MTLVGRTEEELEEVAEGIRAEGGEAITALADVSDEAAVEQAVQATLEKFGRLDVVVANAGVNGTWAGIEDLTVEDFRSTLEINLTGTFITLKATVPHVGRGGSAVVIASVNGTRIFSNTGASAYSASKAGQVALTKMLAVELGPRGIRVNVICPGAIDSEISDNTSKRHAQRARVRATYPDGNVPLTNGEPGTAGDVAKLVRFLLSDDSGHITGTPIWIDGAQSLLL